MLTKYLVLRLHTQFCILGDLYLYKTSNVINATIVYSDPADFHFNLPYSDLLEAKTTPEFRRQQN